MRQPASQKTAENGECTASLARDLESSWEGWMLEVDFETWNGLLVAKAWLECEKSARHNYADVLEQLKGMTSQTRELYGPGIERTYMMRAGIIGRAGFTSCFQQRQQP